MSKVAKIAISLPQDVLEAVEMERKVTGESRSEFLRRAVVIALHQERERATVESYVQGYLTVPETAEETELAHRTGTAILAGDPWE